MPYKNYNQDMNSYMKERWRKRRAAAIIRLGSVCIVCGANENLEFDHIDPDTKLCSVARASSFSEVRFWNEVRKCQLLCTDCHKEKHIAR